MKPEHANEETTWPENQTMEGHPDEVCLAEMREEMREEMRGGGVAARGISGTEKAEPAMRTPPKNTAATVHSRDVFARPDAPGQKPGRRAHLKENDDAACHTRR